MQVAHAAAACGAVPRTGDMDLVQVRRAFKFRAYPTWPQEGRAVRLLADHCDLYNAAWRNAARRGGCGGRISYGMQSAQLKKSARPTRMARDATRSPPSSRLSAGSMPCSPRSTTV